MHGLQRSNPTITGAITSSRAPFGLLLDLRTLHDESEKPLRARHELVGFVDRHEETLPQPVLTVQTYDSAEDPCTFVFVVGTVYADRDLVADFNFSGGIDYGHVGAVGQLTKSIRAVDMPMKSAHFFEGFETALDDGTGYVWLDCKKVLASVDQGVLG